MNNILLAEEQDAYILGNFEQALSEKRILVYYQPVIRSISGEVCGMEALARWEDPFYGVLSPAVFIPVLESNHLIYQVDLYILRRICEDLRVAEKLGYEVIPISFNLSRYDFGDCDMFTEIESIVQEYGVARDMINIEITETMMMDHPEQTYRTIKALHDVGYQVWMDDFGSGYSSLNVLKDYRFDEIKLDMVFMKNFDDRARSIVTSIVSMAKKIGVQTLAEGVETKEHAEFLKNIGCEKLQGYYCSRPLPIQELISKLEGENRRMERRAMRSYYDRIGQIDFMTDRPLGIVESDGKRLWYLFKNEKLLEVWHRAGVYTEEEIDDQMNSPVSQIYRMIRNYGRTLRESDDYKEMDFIVNGQYMRCRAKCIAKHGERALFDIELRNMAVSKTMEEQEKTDQCLRVIQPSLDTFLLIDLKHNRIQSLLHGGSGDRPAMNQQTNFPVMELNKLVAEAIIHPDDREEFYRFTDGKTVRERIMQGKRGYLTNYFRTKEENGAYVWKAHSMYYTPGDDCIVYGMKYAPLLEKEMINRLLHDKEMPRAIAKTLPNGQQDGALSTMESALWKQLLESKTIHLFWKDTNRRFVGANQKFLDTFGFSDATAVIGKTDEELHWHIDDEPFRENEEFVLKVGGVSVNKLGKCIIRGVPHNILATKEPLYRNGEIVGLFGVFVNMDELVENIGQPGELLATDTVTGLSSGNGMMNFVPDFIEGWETRGESFAVLRLSLVEYHRIIKSYGSIVADRLLCLVADVLRKEVGNSAAIARLFVGNFVIYMKYQKQEEVEALKKRVEEQISAIHNIEEYRITIHPEIDVFYADDISDKKRLVSISTAGIHQDITNSLKLNDKLDYYHIPFETIVNAFPGGILLLELYDGEPHIVYASRGMETLTGRPAADFLKVQDFHLQTGTDPEDIHKVEKAIHYAVETGSEMNITYRIILSEEEKYWVNMRGRVIGEQDGHPILMAIYQTVGGAKTVKPVIDNYLHYHLEERNLQKTLDMISDGNINIFTSSGEVAHSKQELRQALKFEMDALPDPFELEFIHYNEMPISDTVFHVGTVLKARSTDRRIQNRIYQCHVICILRLENGEWKIASLFVKLVPQIS